MQKENYRFPKKYPNTEAGSTAAKILVSQNKDKSFKILDRAFNFRVKKELFDNNKRFKPICTEVFKEIAKFYPLEAKEFVEGFEDSRFKLGAFTAVVEGIIESIVPTMRFDKVTQV